MILDLLLISWLDSGVGGRERRGVLWQQKCRGSCPKSGSVSGCLTSHLQGAAGTGQLCTQLPAPGSQPWVAHVTEKVEASLRGHGDHQGGSSSPRED